MKKTIKKIIEPAYQKFKKEISKQKIRHILTEKEDLLIELGAGNKSGKNGWLTIDMTRNCDIFWDLRNGIPFPNESITKIYSSHFFEHLTYKEGQDILDECLRVLIPGGIFSICVPNARLYVEAYLFDTDFDIDMYIGYKPAFNNVTKIDYINYIAYMDGHHKFMFDEENLIQILKLKGLNNVHLRPFDPTIDLEERNIGSIYAEAEK